MKFFMFRIAFLTFVCATAFFSTSYSAVWYSVASGNAETGSVWSLTPAGAGTTAAALGGFNSTVDLIVQSGTVLDLTSTGNININNLQVDAGGQFYSTNTANRYANVYGNILCNGIIGGNGVYNSICFNIEGLNTILSGTGTFEASRMRKNSTVNLITNFTVAMNVNLRWNSGTATQIYNNAPGTAFNVTINAGVTVNLIAGNISIDGLAGNGFNEISGSLTVHGTLNVSNIIYMQTNNAIGGNSCNIIIGPTGLVRALQVAAGASNAAGHTLTIQSGGKLEMTGSPAFTPFSTNFNTYSCLPGSFVEYSASASQTVQAAISYGNLWVSGSGLKYINGNIISENDIRISGAAVLVASGYIINLKGNWINWSAAGFSEDVSTVVFNGSAVQQLTCPSGEGFYNITTNKPAGTLDLNDPVVITGTFSFISGVVNASAVALPKFEAGSTTSGASDISHVNGPVLKTGSTDFAFPVGKNGHFRPIAITMLAAAEIYVAEYFQSDPQTVPLNVFSHDPTIDHVSRCEYWSLQSLSGGVAAITLSWNNATSCGVSSLSDLRVARWDGVIWRDLGNGGTIGNTLTGTITSAGVTTEFDYFTLSSVVAGLNPLPVDWLYFHVVLLSDSIQLHWATATEFNADYFEVQRSVDGIHYNVLGYVRATGNSISPVNYKFYDNCQVTGNLYYRLRQVDFDGDFEFSPVRLLHYAKKYPYLFVYPYLSSTTININVVPYDEGSDVRIVIADALARVVFDEFRDPASVISLNVDGFVSGKYFISVFYKGRTPLNGSFIKH